MQTLEFLMTWPIKVFAILVSLGYGLFATKVFLPKASLPAIREEHFWWKFHQFWLNAVGNMTGWIILYFLLKRLIVLKVSNYTIELSGQDYLLGVIAFIGITGYLPLTIVSTVNSISLLFQKVAELLAKTLTKP